MTEGGEASALAATIDAYCACWAVMETAARRAALSRCVAADIRYADPMVALAGIPALSDHIAQVTAARPEAVISRCTKVDAHHTHARFGWNLRDGKETLLVGSIDVVEWEPRTGLLTRITGFFGPLEA
ncbi:hypothetical protein [Vannielia sp. SX4]|uniref:hypothetical protein n=1 Tax=Vannielia sp. SX4 TaxID=3463852 RepID=UPI0040583418